jgi:hypothetical protein
MRRVLVALVAAYWVAAAVTTVMAYRSAADDALWASVYWSEANIYADIEAKEALHWSQAGTEKLRNQAIASFWATQHMPPGAHLDWLPAKPPEGSPPAAGWRAAGKTLAVWAVGFVLLLGAGRAGRWVWRGFVEKPAPPQ